MPRAKIGLGLGIAATIVGCSLVDAARGGGSNDDCQIDGNGVCDFCRKRLVDHACGEDTVKACFDNWTCELGPQPGCGFEFAQMLDFFRASPAQCYSATLPQVQTFESCKVDEGGISCFQR